MRMQCLSEEHFLRSAVGVTYDVDAVARILNAYTLEVIDGLDILVLLKLHAFYGGCASCGEYLYFCKCRISIYIIVQGD